MSVRGAAGWTLEVLRPACEILRQRIARNIAPNISDSNEEVPVGTIWRPAKRRDSGQVAVQNLGATSEPQAAELLPARSSLHQELWLRSKFVLAFYPSIG